MSAPPEKEGLGGETEAKDDGVDQSCCTSSQGSERKQDTSVRQSQWKRPPWFGIEISIVGSAPKRRLSLSLLAPSLRVSGMAGGKIESGALRRNIRANLSKPFKKAIRTPQRALKKLSTGQKRIAGHSLQREILGRANDKLEAHSGFLGLDLDKLGAETRVDSAKPRN